MFVLVSAVATILACSGAFAQLTEDDRNQVERHNDSRRLLSTNQTFYLLYRSETNDSALPDAQCTQTRHIEGFEKRRTVSVFRKIFYVHHKGHINRHFVVIYPNKSNEILTYDDSMTIKILAFYLAPGPIYSDLLFTDYSTCFTVRRPANDMYELWSIGRPNLTNINQGCHSAYEEDPDTPGCTVDRPKYYIFNETVCCHTRPIE
uniref:Putative salivary lipocalin n=1 Tax=Ixodes ricinus TaxID=34613 RepID=A0A147BWP3_IXORI